MKSTLALIFIFAMASSVAAITIDTVPVGNPGNAPDSTTVGAVSYEYRIGKYEVTFAQYAEFLNAVAGEDPFELYDTKMGSGSFGGIIRNGTSGHYTYTQKSLERANNPVNYVTWFDAIRFVNWLNNGQGGPGTTEYGAYTLEGGTPTATNSLDIVRNPSAIWVLPTNDEWYKAAYFDPTSATYFNYATSNNSAPAAIAPPGYSNSAAYKNLPFTDVGAYVDSPSPYGTFDQAGKGTG
jgi:formylglycine-generating enzyme